jgi:hypothetical protein
VQRDGAAECPAGPADLPSPRHHVPQLRLVIDPTLHHLHKPASSEPPPRNDDLGAVVELHVAGARSSTPTTGCPSVAVATRVSESEPNHRDEPTVIGDTAGQRASRRTRPHSSRQRRTAAIKASGSVTVP